MFWKRYIYIYTYTYSYTKYLFLIVLFVVSHIIPTFSGKTLALFLMKLNATLRKNNTWITVKIFSLFDSLVIKELVISSIIFYFGVLFAYSFMPY